MTENQNPPVDNTETELAVLEETVHNLAIPVQSAELIADALNFLAEHGADDKAAVLNDIYDATSAMLQTAQQLDQGFRASLNIAKTLRQQREDARQALADLKEAIDTCDVENPEIEALAESIREEQDEMLWYFFEEMLIDHLVDDTPLTYQEGSRFIQALREIDAGDVLIAELKEWIERAYAVVCPPVPDFDD